MKNGAIVDMDAAEASVRAAVGAAEEMAGANVNAVNVALSGPVFKSRLVAYDIGISGHEIGDQDLRKILDANRLASELPEDQEIVHSIPVGYSIDGNRGVRDPRGMFGDRLGVNLHVVTASINAIRNIDTCLHRCHLEVEGRVVAPYASALSALVEDEMKLGVTLIDMGGGTTSIAVFFDGELVHADCIPIGGASVTNDIARGLSTPVQHAERMKTLYGNCMPSPSDDLEVIKVPLIGEEQTGETNPVPRSMLVGIIRPRIEETFELVRDHLHAAGFDLSGADAGERLAEALEAEDLLTRLIALHFNDCEGPCGCARDRHAAPGEGTIGAGLLSVAGHEAFRALPLILEVDPAAAMRGIAYLGRG